MNFPIPNENAESATLSSTQPAQISPTWAGVLRTAVCTAVFALSPWAIGEVVYENTKVFKTSGGATQNYRTLGTEIGDEIVLGGTARDVRQITFEYAAFFENRPNASAVVRLYVNDGADADPGPKVISAPGTLLWESDAFNLQTTAERGVQVTLAVPGVVVPDRFTWSLKVSNVAPGEVGLLLADGPGPGRSFDDFWEKQNGVWVGRRIISEGIKNSFHARIQAGALAPVVPPLSIAPTGEGVQLKWQDTGADCDVLKANFVDGKGTWAAIPLNPKPTPSNGQYTVSLPADGTGGAFFRLGCR